MKRVTIGAKPQNSAGQLSSDNWVSDRPKAVAEPIKRLTLDVSVRLHKRIKSQCAIRGVNMAEEIRQLLETHFPEE